MAGRTAEGTLEISKFCREYPINPRTIRVNLGKERKIQNETLMPRVFLVGSQAKGGERDSDVWCHCYRGSAPLLEPLGMTWQRSQWNSAVVAIGLFICFPPSNVRLCLDGGDRRRMEKRARSCLLKMLETLGFSSPLMPELWSPFHVRGAEHACLRKFWKDPGQSEDPRD